MPFYSLPPPCLIASLPHCCFRPESSLAILSRAALARPCFAGMRTPGSARRAGEAKGQASQGNAICEHRSPPPPPSPSPSLPWPVARTKGGTARDENRLTKRDVTSKNSRWRMQPLPPPPRTSPVLCGILPPPKTFRILLLLLLLKQARRRISSKAPFPLKH
jgi:hypothetical protein